LCDGGLYNFAFLPMATLLRLSDYAGQAIFSPNKDHILPDSGNFWSSMAVLGSFGNEDHREDH